MFEDKSLSPEATTEESVGQSEINPVVESQGCSTEKGMAARLEISTASGEPKETPLEGEFDGTRSTARLPLSEFSFLQSKNFRTKESDDARKIK